MTNFEYIFKIINLSVDLMKEALLQNQNEYANNIKNIKDVNDDNFGLMKKYPKMVFVNLCFEKHGYQNDHDQQLLEHLWSENMNKLFKPSNKLKNNLN
jgi:hypothetical protein